MPFPDFAVSIFPTPASACVFKVQTCQMIYAFLIRVPLDDWPARIFFPIVAGLTSRRNRGRQKVFFNFKREQRSFIEPKNNVFHTLLGEFFHHLITARFFTTPKWRKCLIARICDFTTRPLPLPQTIRRNCKTTTSTASPYYRTFPSTNTY